MTSKQRSFGEPPYHPDSHTARASPRGGPFMPIHSTSRALCAVNGLDLLNDATTHGADAVEPPSALGARCEVRAGQSVRERGSRGRLCQTRKLRSVDCEQAYRTQSIFLSKHTLQRSVSSSLRAARGSDSPLGPASALPSAPRETKNRGNAAGGELGAGRLTRSTFDSICAELLSKATRGSGGGSTGVARSFFFNKTVPAS